MTWFSPVARPPLLHIHTSIIIIIIIMYKEGRKTGTHTRHHIQHKRSQSYAPVHTRCLEGPKNDGGVPPPQSPKKLGRWQCSKYTSGGGKYTGRRGSMTRGGKAVAGTMRGCPSLPPTAGGGAFGSILRLTFSFFSVFSFSHYFYFFKFYVFWGGEEGWGFKILFASTWRFNLLKISPVDDDDIIIQVSQQKAFLSYSVTISTYKLLRYTTRLTLYIYAVLNDISSINNGGSNRLTVMRYVLDRDLPCCR